MSGSKRTARQSAASVEVQKLLADLGRYLSHGDVVEALRPPVLTLAKSREREALLDRISSALVETTR